MNVAEVNLSLLRSLDLGGECCRVHRYATRNTQYAVRITQDKKKRPPYGFEYRRSRKRPSDLQ